MKLKKIEIGKKYRINYKYTMTRGILWNNGLLPPPGTIVIVKNIREDTYTQPITIEDLNENSYHCNSADLIPYKEKEKDGKTPN